MAVLIVGGTKGLGLEMAKQARDRGDHVIITGRDRPEEPGFEFRFLELGRSLLDTRIALLVQDLPPIDTFVYAAGFFQRGVIGDLSDEEIMKMMRIGLHAPMFLLRDLLRKQGKLGGFVAVTSTSARYPRVDEPVYAAAKAGLAHFAESVAATKVVGDQQFCDTALGKVLHLAPSGMKTPFWEDTDMDTSTMLDPADVARVGWQQYELAERFRYVQINRDAQTGEMFVDVIRYHVKTSLGWKMAEVPLRGR